MAADDLDEDGTVLTASPELDDGAGTPDLLADSPPDAPSPNAARVTPRVLFPARQPPVTEIAAPPAAAAGSPRQAHEPEADPDSAGGGSEWSRGRQSERELSGERVQSPMGCYSTLASHHRGEGSAGGHELPACFASPPTSPPMTARSQHPDEAMDTISLADPPSATQEAAENAQSRDVELLEAENTTIEAGSGSAPAKAAGTPMAGLRDLFAPVGGLFKGAFTASSQPPLPAPLIEDQHEAAPLQNGNSQTAAAGEETASGSAAEEAQLQQSTAAAHGSELTRALNAKDLTKTAAGPQDALMHQEPGSGVEFTAASPVSGTRCGPLAEAEGSEAGLDRQTHSPQEAMVPGDSLPAPGQDLAQAETQSFSEEQPLDGNAASPQDVAVRSGREGSDSSPTGMMGNAPFSEQSKASDTVESDTGRNSVELPSTGDVLSTARSSSGDLHREVLEHGVHPLNSDNTAPSSSSMEALSAPSNDAGSHPTQSFDASAPESDASDDRMPDSPLDHGVSAKPPFRGKHRR